MYTVTLTCGHKLLWADLKYLLPNVLSLSTIFKSVLFLVSFFRHQRPFRLARFLLAVSAISQIVFVTARMLIQFLYMRTN